MNLNATNSFGLIQEANSIEEAVNKALNQGYRTVDIAKKDQKREMDRASKGKYNY